MPRPKSLIKSIHTAVRLPADLHKKLSEAGRGALAEEIKRRLESSFAFEAMDPPTRELLAAILQMAELVHGDVGLPWHTNAYLRAVLGEAITAWLADKVPGDANVPSVNAKASAHVSHALLNQGDTAKIAGKKLLHFYKVARAPHDAATHYQDRLRTNPLLRQADEQWRREQAFAKQGKKP
jgi:hypothetical protein